MRANGWFTRDILKRKAERKTQVPQCARCKELERTIALLSRGQIAKALVAFKGVKNE